MDEDIVLHKNLKNKNKNLRDSSDFCYIKLKMKGIRQNYIFIFTFTNYEAKLIIYVLNYTYS